MKIKEICDSNKLLRQNETGNTEESKRKNASRKISLTCQTWQRHPACAAAPRTSSGRLRSPQLSPVSSPLTSPKPTKMKNRFSITLVKENNQGTIIKQDKPSRFTVYNVQEPVKKTIGFDCPSTSCEPSTSNGLDSVIKTRDRSTSCLDAMSTGKTEFEPSVRNEDVQMKNEVDDVSVSSFDTPMPSKSEDDSVLTSSPSSSEGEEERVRIKDRNEEDDEMEYSDEPHQRYDRFTSESVDHHNGQFY